MTARQPRDQLRAECDEAYDRYCLTLGGGRGSTARYERALNAYVAAHDRWADARAAAGNGA